MSDGPVLGIDLGTTNSVVAVADGGQARVLTDEEGRRLLPSVVSFHPNGDTLVGYEARERRLVDAENTVYAIKRLIGRPYDSFEVAKARERFAFKIGKSKHGSSVVEVRRGKYALAEISAMVLRQLRRIAEAQLGEGCQRAVVTVPANFNELQRSATKAAGKVAGLDVLRIINEPTAAALAYGFGKGTRERIAVYDLGGGTFDITILELDDDVFEVLATAGDTFLGGEDIDGAIADRMAASFLSKHSWDPRSDGQAYERLKAAAEWAKCELSSRLETEMTIEELTHGRGGKPLDLQYSLTRAELDALARPWIQRTFNVCDEVLESAGIGAGEISNVVLVGGMTRMPIVHSTVQGYFGRPPKRDIDPDLVVAQGAAIHGYAIGGSAQNIRPAKRRSTLGKVLLKRMSKAQVEERRAARKRRHTMLGMPRQPAFSPEERPPSDLPPSQPRPPSAPPAPPPMPDLPDAPTGIHIDPPASMRQVNAVISAPVVMVTTPKSTIEMELDDLEPTSDLPAPLGGLDDLAPPELSSPFAADLDPFSAPKRGAALGGSWPPSGPTSEAPLDDPFGNLDLPVPAAPLPAMPPPPAPEALPMPSPPPRPPVPPPAPQAAPKAAPIAPPVAARAPPVAPPAAPPQPALAQEVVQMPPTKAPILMDVTPHSLGIETVGGYCRRLIGKNAPIPTEQTRIFTTARDHQVEVAVRICQGESDAFEKNQVLGEVVLDALVPKLRGQLQIEVAFILDTDGTLGVQAKDAASGRSTHTRISLRGGLSPTDVEAMRARLAAEERR